MKKSYTNKSMNIILLCTYAGLDMESIYLERKLDSEGDPM